MFDPSLTLSVRVSLFFVIVWFLVLSVVGSRVQSEAARLEGELALALEELERSRVAEQKALEARMAASARLTRLEKVREKVRSKEWRLAEQGLRELELEEAKMDSVREEAETVRTPVVDPVDDPARLSPSTDPFVFGSFSMMPDPFSSDTPIPFP
jgi:hypothetical protein